MERVGDTTYLQHGWEGESELLQSDDLQEILAQFESTAYLKDLNIFGAPESSISDKPKGMFDPLTLPESFLLDDAQRDAKRKLKDGKDSKISKKGKKVVEEPPLEALTEGELAKRRESHNATERRRREKINEKIDELRKLLPGGGKGVNKAAVLHQTAERMKSLQVLFNRLLTEKRRLESSRNELLEDVYRLRTALAHYQHTYGAPGAAPAPPAAQLPPRVPHLPSVHRPGLFPHDDASSSPLPVQTFEHS